MQEYLGSETRYPLAFTCSGVKVPVKKIFRFYAVPDVLYVSGLFETCSLTSGLSYALERFSSSARQGDVSGAELDGEQLNLYGSGKADRKRPMTKQTDISRLLCHSCMFLFRLIVLVNLTEKACGRGGCAKLGRLRLTPGCPPLSQVSKCRKRSEIL